MYVFPTANNKKFKFFTAVNHEHKEIIVEYKICCKSQKLILQYHQDYNKGIYTDWELFILQL